MSRHSSSPELCEAEPPSSSPPLPSYQPCKSVKLKKPPPVTPNRFNRFFNPRSSSSTSSRSSRALRELTASGANRANAQSRQYDDDAFSSTPRKRMRLSNSDLASASNSDAILSSSPPLPRSSPCQNYDYRGEQRYLQPIVRSKFHTRVSQEYNHGTCAKTAAFYSSRDDQHVFSHPQLPFCTAACNTNSLVAIGTERGAIHLLESAGDSKPPFNQTYLEFAPHQNAIMDLAFTSDDERLASASGDQCAKITDMRTQTTIYVLSEHTSSLKQVIFQPGNEDIVATCSRDSVVALWDLRCANAGPVVRNKALSKAQPETQTKPKFPSVYKSISNWQYDHSSTDSNQSLGNSSPLSSTPTSSSEASGRSIKQLNNDRSVTRETASITSMRFLPQSPHHIITSSDVSSRLRVWDIRSRLLSTRTRTATPIQLPVSISATVAQYSKGHRREYGTTSLTLSNDAARLYAVSRDNSVQVYSTQHLVLGQAPDSGVPCRQNPTRVKTRTGLQGAPPLYTLRHPLLRVASFYIRASIRRTGPSSLWPEVLAVGSSDGCAVLFPTDTDPKLWDSPIARQGTPLMHGHKREVTGLSWTYDGELISCGDDYVARVWREDKSRVAKLRNSHPQAIDESGTPVAAGCGWSLLPSSYAPAQEETDHLDRLPDSFDREEA